MKNLPENNDEKSIHDKITKSLRDQISKAYSWFDSSEGKIISKTLASLASFGLADPTGIAVPLILECSDYLVRRRFVKHFPDLASRITNLENLNHQFVESEQGQKLLKETMKQIIHETNEEKIEYLKKFLVTSYSNQDIDSERVTSFFKILVNMEPIHMKLLTVLKNPRKVILDVCKQRQQNPRPEGMRPHGKLDSATFWEDHGKDDLNEFYLHSDPLVYVNGHKDLLTWNIISNKIIRFWMYFHDSTFESNLDKHIREMERWITPFGKEFMKYIFDNEK